MSHNEDKVRLDAMLRAARAIEVVPEPHDDVAPAPVADTVADPVSPTWWDDEYLVDIDDADAILVAHEAWDPSPRRSTRVRILERVTIALPGGYRTFLPGSKYVGALAEQIAAAASDSPYVRVEEID